MSRIAVILIVVVAGGTTLRAQDGRLQRVRDEVGLPAETDWLGGPRRAGARRPFLVLTGRLRSLHGPTIRPLGRNWDNPADDDLIRKDA